jgi:hypothetical protein
MKTQILVEITHKHPLPKDLSVTDVVSQRVYGYLVTKGQQSEVTAKVWQESDDEGEPK